ncbi:alpha-N-acetylglucosaminidase [Haloactinospora alba]|uniref:Alpha-N-acetylglucosaminidase n=1 Tax=Haloactinospora alba TaxID=405555 RepID=A0A543NHA9_9ACTN|nr:alpha-N-acetylglucosaminidase [Haloactinospora alba]TQN31211.1 alpha-N-acetylglucosaminidase [Haloactinospora alba]
MVPVPRDSRTAAPHEGSGAHGLLRRVLGERCADFTPVTIPAQDGRDVFEVESTRSGVVLRGSSPVAQASALRWYLTRVCESDVSWDTHTVALPARLPGVGRCRRVTPFRHRYCFNFCTFSYSMAFWGWPEWEREIDRMALHGVTMPLAVTGQEAVWQQVCRRLGMEDAETRVFLGGSAYLPFTWMGCTEGWGGPLPQSWIDARAELGRRIVERERELGMTPVLQAFAGHVPARLDRGERMRWFDFTTRMLDPRDPQFQRIGGMFLTEQVSRFGTDHWYAADPFIEMTPSSGEPRELARVARAVHEPMVAADPQAVWVMQGWPFAYRDDFWRPERVRCFLGAVPDRHMLVLDLWGEQRPLWRETAAFHGKPWVWCMVHNFGGRPGMHGKLPRVASELDDARQHPGRGDVHGAGLAMEASGTDPVVYAHWADEVWRERSADVRRWVGEYAARRYGRRDERVERAWRLLLDTVYSVWHTSGPPVSVVASRPTVEAGLDVAAPLRPDSGAPAWNPAALARAWRLLLEAAPAEADAPGSAYGRDLVDVGQQVLARAGREIHRRAVATFRARDGQAARAHFAEFLELVNDLETLLTTREEYALDPWLDAARAWGRTEEERNVHEWNARRIVTVWGPRESRLQDYAGRHWSGLVGGYYLPRWRLWTTFLGHALARGGTPDAEGFDRALGEWEERWCSSRERYSPLSRPATVATSRRLFARYADMCE